MLIECWVYLVLFSSYYIDFTKPVYIYKPEKEIKNYLLRKQFPDKLRMAVQCMEHKGESQTYNSSSKKESKYNLLLQLYLDGGPGQEINGHGDERHAPQ